MKKYVFDSSAILTFFNGEEGVEEVSKLIKASVAGECDLLLSPVNYGEVYYVIYRSFGAQKAEEAMERLEELNFTIPALQPAQAKGAGLLKVLHRLGYADAFAAELARSEKAILVTADKEFALVEDQMKIHWVNK